MKISKGFTLIELLVVIAIIGILSSVVLASLTTARTKGQDAAVQQQLSAMRSQAELFYSSNGNNYGTKVAACTGTLFTGTNGLAALLAGATKSGGTVTCATGGAGANADSWAVKATLPSLSTLYYCVDSTGRSGTSTSGTVGSETGAVCGA